MGETITHGACGRSWVQRGNRSGHCAGCHETFYGLRAFDGHRQDGACLDPTTKPDVWWQDSGGQWHNRPPMTPDEVARLASGGAK